jgi:hypothetical protein
MDRPQLQQPSRQEEEEEWQRRAALAELWRWAPQVQNQLAKLERFTNQAVGECGTRIDYLETQAEQLVSENRKLRYQLELANRDRKELREEIEKLLRVQPLPPIPSPRPSRPPLPPHPNRHAESESEEDSD